MKNIRLTLAIVLALALNATVFSQARVQVIHNSADEAAAVVDVWINDQVLLDDFAFRTASPFVDAPAGVDFDISILPPNSTDTNGAVAKFTYNLADGGKYILVANGFVSPTGYDPVKPFNIDVYDMAREEALSGDGSDVLVMHGSTDAPVVDVKEVGQGAGTIVDDIAYGEFAGYLELPTADYSLQIRNSAGTYVVAQYGAPLATLGLEGAAMAVVASGFLNPGNNSGGPAFGLFVALSSGGELVELPSEDISTARAQVIHNSADELAAVVDIWFNDQMLLDDFAFRTASPFIDVPAGVDFDISVLPPTSTDTSGSVAKYTYNLEGNGKYVLVANGVVNLPAYNPPQPFNIDVYAMGREIASSPTNIDLLVAHGSTDAPVVDVVEVAQGAGTIIDDMAYSDFSGYLELPTADYSLQIRNSSGTEVVAQYGAPLQTLGLEGSAIVVVASGFLNPGENSDGPSFGLYAVLPTGGDLVQLPTETISTARAQVIHNSADAAAETVDIWLNDQILLDDFAFRTASPFVDVPAGEDIDISVLPPNSMDTNGAIAKFTYNLAGNGKYILVASGIVSGSGYNPPQPFDIYVYDMAREMATSPDNSDVLVMHGSTDAPVVDVVEVAQGAGTIVDDIAYSEFAGYLELPTADYSLQIRNSAGTDVVAQFGAPLATLGLDGAAMAVLASGFLNPGNNSGGPAFGLYVALPSGGELVELPSEDISTARAQVIHNSADAAAEVVDVWFNDQILLDDFTFRTASPFVDVPAGEDFDISILPPNSMDTNGAIAKFTYNLMGNGKYILVANGIVSGTGYDPVKPFDIYVYDMAREIASDPANTDVLSFHGSTDAPIVDVVETGVGAGTIIDNFEYGNFAGYLELGTADYELSITDETGETTVAVFNAPLATLGLEGAAITLLASGFLAPENNSDGPAFGLFAALPSGGALVSLESTTSIEEEASIINDFRIYPNPATNNVNISFNLDRSAETNLSIIDITGKEVYREILSGTARNYTMVDINNLPGGMYFARIISGKDVATKKIKIIR